jgi:CheY-like chemotaxis protein
MNIFRKKKDELDMQMKKKVNSRKKAKRKPHGSQEHNREYAPYILKFPKMGHAEAKKKNPSTLPGPVASARILVVDDDPIICDVIRDVLASRYEIEIALNGREATKKIQNNSLDLLIMDYHLPGLNGKQLYEWIASHYPSLKRHIVFSTGDMYDENVVHFIESTGCPCLFKPFSNSALRETVSQTLKC